MSKTEAQLADGRVTWDAYFMGMAHYVSGRGTCDRKRVGAVLVRDRRVIATGYNGAPPGVDHCTVAGHDLDGEGHCTRASHAERNALDQCARYGVATEGAVLYSTVMPCWRCYGGLLSVGVSTVYYEGDYWPDDERVGRRLAALQGAPRAPALVRLQGAPVSLSSSGGLAQVGSGRIPVRVAGSSHYPQVQVELRGAVDALRALGDARGCGWCATLARLTQAQTVADLAAYVTSVVADLAMERAGDYPPTLLSDAYNACERLRGALAKNSGRQVAALEAVLWKGGR